VIDDTIDYGRPLELPPRFGRRYHCFVDASAGRHDSFALCIGHLEGAKGEETFVADVVRGRKAPFDPRSVAHEYAQLARDYGCTTIIGDNFAGEWVSGEFRDAGARYEKTPVPKSTLYLESLPYFNRGCVFGPDQSDLMKELRDLERRTHRSGKDTVDHPKRGSDDLANAFCGCMYVAFKETRRPKMMQGTIDFAKTGRVTWKDNGERPRLRFEVITEQEDLLHRGLEVSGPAKPKNGLAP
jgi:hypothetical protein